MPIISPTAISPHRIGKAGINWSSYWTTLISATVENSAPTNVVLTFPAPASTVATDITATVNGVAREVSSASWTGGVWTVVLASAVEYGDVVVMTFVPSGGTTSVTNNVLTYAALLESTEDGTGVSTLRMQVSANITVTLGANAKFYSDSGGTADESATWILTAGAMRTIYLRCTTGTAAITFSDASKVTKIGSLLNDGWVSSTNAAKITFTFNKFHLNEVNIKGKALLIGPPPSEVNTLLLIGTNVFWTYAGSLQNTTYLFMQGNNIAWDCGLPISTEMTFISCAGNLINYTNLDFTGTGNIGYFNLLNYRIAKLTSADLLTMLASLTNRVGTLPATITINDYADYNSPPQAVVDAVAALKTAKSITTVNLGA